MVNQKRITKSLRTKDYNTAKRLKSLTETTIIQQLNGFTKSNAELSFPELVDRFLKAPHPWSKSTYDLNKYILTSHLHDEELPANPSSRATHIRHINQCWKWGFKNNLVSKMKLIPVDTKGESRLRTYKECELNLMFTMIKDDSFNAFVRFAYYTGARSGEIRSLSRDCVLEGHKFKSEVRSNHLLTGGNFVLGYLSIGLWRDKISHLVSIFDNENYFWIIPWAFVFSFLNSKIVHLKPK